MQTALELVFIGLSLWVLWAFCQYGKPPKIYVGPVTFGGTPMDPPTTMTVTCVRAGAAAAGRTVEIRRVRGSVTIRAAAGAHVVID